MTAWAIVSTMADRISRMRANAARARAGSGGDTARRPGFGPAHGFSATGAVVVFVALSASSNARRIAAAACPLAPECPSPRYISALTAASSVL